MSKRNLESFLPKDAENFKAESENSPDSSKSSVYSDSELFDDQSVDLSGSDEAAASLSGDDLSLDRPRFNLSEKFTKRFFKKESKQQLVDQLVADMKKLNLNTVTPFNPSLDNKNFNWLADQHVRQKFAPQSVWPTSPVSSRFYYSPKLNPSTSDKVSNFDFSKRQSQEVCSPDVLSSKSSFPTPEISSSCRSQPFVDSSNISTSSYSFPRRTPLQFHLTSYYWKSDKNKINFNYSSEKTENKNNNNSSVAIHNSCRESFPINKEDFPLNPAVSFNATTVVTKPCCRLSFSDRGGIEIGKGVMPDFQEIRNSLSDQVQGNAWLKSPI
jgi:hypothetical protein